MKNADNNKMATMLVGAETLVEKKEVALSIEGQQALGMTGLILVTIAAAFSTGSAINTTALVGRPFILKRVD